VVIHGFYEGIHLESLGFCARGGWYVVLKELLAGIIGDGTEVYELYWERSIVAGLRRLFRERVD
jgi:hypothetical protein